MNVTQTSATFKFWLYAKLRLGVYRASVPRRLKNLAVTVSTYSNSEDLILNTNNQSIYIEEKWLDELSECYKFGGYKKFLGKFYWSHKKFKYFDFRNNIFDGIPNLLKSTQLLHLQDVLYFPRALRPNEVSKYTFRVKKNRSSNFDIEHAIAFDLGGADSFQHFIQDCLPIILMSKEILTLKSNLVLLLPPSNLNFQTRTELIRILGITNKIIESGSQSIAIKNLYYWNFDPLNAKFILPAGLESKLFKIFREQNTNNIQNKIILITRNEASRNFANLEIILSSLTDLAKDLDLEFNLIDSSTAKLNEYKEELPKAKIVVSMHGGANYNLIFCSAKTLFFEFIPMKETNTLINFFKNSGLTYIPVPIDFRFKQPQSVTIPEHKLREIHAITKTLF